MIFELRLFPLTDEFQILLAISALCFYRFKLDEKQYRKSNFDC